MPVFAMTAARQILLKDYKPKSLLRLPDHTPVRARFPAIDAHNHLFNEIPPEELVRIMDAAGVSLWLNATGNVTLPLEGSTYTIARRPFSVFAEQYMMAYPGRFAAFTMAEFAQWDDFVLLKDDDFAARCIQTLEQDVDQGACGLKVTKELGLRFTDCRGKTVAVDDPRLAPVWDRAGALGLPVLIHVSDPVGFFLPVDEQNEHCATLQEFPAWSFADAPFGKHALLEQRNRLVARHRDTTFILPHVANHAEDLADVARLLDACPNAAIDFSARIDELGRQPYSAREFLVRYQDRVLFGLDMPVSEAAYRCYFRFLETHDEHFDYPDYIGRFGGCSRWKICGLDLPDAVLRKIYRDNALRLIPRLAE